MFIDVHAHLDMEDFYDGFDVDKMLDDCLDRNTKKILVNGINFDSNISAKRYSKKYSHVLACYGLYPLEVYENQDDVKKTLHQLENEDYFAIGEVGLDFKETEKREEQIEIFKKIIDIANERNKVLIVHSRKAERETIDILKERLKGKVIMHCFSGKLSYVKELKDDSRFFFSIPTNVTRSEHFQKMIEILPIGKLFAETDSPFLSPNKEEFPNKPYNVSYTYNKIAEIKGLDITEVENLLLQNFLSVF